MITASSKQILRLTTSGISGRLVWPWLQVARSRDWGTCAPPPPASGSESGESGARYTERSGGWTLGSSPPGNGGRRARSWGRRGTWWWSSWWRLPGEPDCRGRGWPGPRCTSPAAPREGAAGREEGRGPELCWGSRTSSSSSPSPPPPASGCCWTPPGASDRSWRRGPCQASHRGCESGGKAGSREESFRKKKSRPCHCCCLGNL